MFMKQENAKSPKFVMSDATFRLGLEKIWQEQWKLFLEDMKGLQNPKTDIQVQLLDNIEAKLRMKWIKGMEAKLPIVYSIEKAPLSEPAQSVQHTIQSGKSLIFERLKLELKFGALFLFVYAALTFMPMSLLSLVFETRYMPLAGLLLIPAVTTMYFTIPFDHESTDKLLLNYTVPLVAGIYWLISSNGPTLGTVLLLWVFTTLYYNFMHRFFWRIIEKTKIFDPFEHFYMLAIRGF
jgi:hypothetical protein